MGGRGNVCNCPVGHMTAILASTSPFFAALKSGPFGILFVGLHADIKIFCYTGEPYRFDDHTSMRLKTSKLSTPKVLSRRLQPWLVLRLLFVNDHICMIHSLARINLIWFQFVWFKSHDFWRAYWKTRSDNTSAQDRATSLSSWGTKHFLFFYFRCRDLKRPIWDELIF